MPRVVVSILLAQVLKHNINAVIVLNEEKPTNGEGGNVGVSIFLAQVLKLKPFRC